MKEKKKSFSDRNMLDSRILVVDDASLNRELIVNYLEQFGFRNIETAVDGVQAIEKVEEFKPDIMVLDLLMPRKNGLEVIKDLRANPHYEQLPIIVQTTINLPEEKVEAWNSGANDILTKPIHKLELISRLNVQLKNLYMIRDLEDYYERSEEDISEARELQSALLPASPYIQDMEKKYNIKIDTMFKASQNLSGDLWGTIDLGNNQFVVWICDFSGKGIRAALNTFRLHTLIQEFKYCADDPGEFIDAINRRLVSLLPLGQFATLLIAVVDLNSDKVTYASASAPHPIIYYPKERRYHLGDGSGVPIGIVDNQSFPIRTLDFPKGASLILYSDLMWEDKALPGISLKEEDLPSFINELNGKHMIETIKQQLDLIGEVDLPDDLTLIEVIRKEN